MNIQQLKYALAVARTGSITKAAESMYVSQPNLSSSLRDLEHEIGTPLFKRTRSGVETTSEGNKFLLKAQDIIDQLDDLEFTYTKERKRQTTLRFSSTRFSSGVKPIIKYINNQGTDCPIHIKYQETSPFNVIDSLVTGESDIGRIFFEKTHYHYYKNLAEQNNLEAEILWEDKASLLLSSDSPLAKEESIDISRLKDYIVVLYSELENSQLSYALIENKQKVKPSTYSVYASDRGTVMEILSACPNCYFWILGTTDEVLKRYNLVQRPCHNTNIFFYEALLYPSNKPLSKETKEIIELCYQSKKKKHTE